MLKRRELFAYPQYSIIFAINIIDMTITDDFDLYAVPMDGECLTQDFDDVDLYGEKLEEDSEDEFADGLCLE